METVALVAGARTAIGKFNGGFAQTAAHELGAAAIAAALERAGVAPDEVDEVVMGQVGQTGPDAYNARRCAIAAGLPVDVTAQTVNRLCSSGLQAIWTAANVIACGDAQIVVAGGDENMTLQPFLAFGERNNARLGDRALRDGTMMLLEDPFGRYQMGETAEIVAERFGITRAEQDAFRSKAKRARSVRWRRVSSMSRSCPLRASNATSTRARIPRSKRSRSSNPHSAKTER